MSAAVAEQKKKRGRFADPNVPNPGRPVGATAKYTRVIKEALLIAAEEHGRNGNGKDKLIGFMRMVLDEDLKTFCMMMARAMTLQVETRTDDGPKEVIYATVDEVKREMASKGISFDVMIRMMRDEVPGELEWNGELIDNEGNEV